MSCNTIQIYDQLILKPLLKIINNSGYGITLPKRKSLNKTKFIFVRQEKQKIVSMIYISIDTIDDRKKCTLIFSFTDPEYREKGHMTQLRNYSIDFAKNMGCESIVSIPFKNAKSLSGLINRGFIKNGQIYILYL